MRYRQTLRLSYTVAGIDSKQLTMSAEAKVAGHYTRGRLEEAILQAVTQAGKDAQQIADRRFGGG